MLPHQVVKFLLAGVGRHWRSCSARSSPSGPVNTMADTRMDATPTKALPMLLEVPERRFVSYVVSPNAVAKPLLAN